jgi:hypothetical protein
MTDRSFGNRRVTRCAMSATRTPAGPATAAVTGDDPVIIA